jgi:hypothetical protein
MKVIGSARLQASPFSVHYESEGFYGTNARPGVFVESKSDLSSTSKCDPDSNCDKYEFGTPKGELGMSFCSTNWVQNAYP